MCIECIFNILKPLALSLSLTHRKQKQKTHSICFIFYEDCFFTVTWSLSFGVIGFDVVVVDIDGGDGERFDDDDAFICRIFIFEDCNWEKKNTEKENHYTNVVEGMIKCCFFYDLWIFKVKTTQVRNETRANRSKDINKFLFSVGEI